MQIPRGSKAVRLCMAGYSRGMHICFFTIKIQAKRKLDVGEECFLVTNAKFSTTNELSTFTVHALGFRLEEELMFGFVAALLIKIAGVFINLY